MAVNLKGRSFVSLLDFTPGEIRYLLDLAHDLKAKKRMGSCCQKLKNKNIVLLFEKTSTRTRCAFEVAIRDEGGHAIFLDKNSSQFGKKESIEDSAKVLGRFFDGIEYRGYKQKIVEDLAKYSGVPVFNGLTDDDHPTQMIADLMTIEEHVHKPLHNVKVVFVGDIRNNMSYAWMYACAKMSMHFVAFGPKELVPDKHVMEKVKVIAKETGATIEVSHDKSSLKGADIIYTDIWVSMGEDEGIMAQRVSQLKDFKVTKSMLDATSNNHVKFMHCLPSYHNFETDVAKAAKEKGLDIREVDDEVFNSKNSIVFDEAENRLHSIKAILVATMS